MREEKGVGVAYVPGNAARASPPQTASSLTAPATGDIGKPMAVAKAGLAEGPTVAAPGARYAGICQVPTSRWGPRFVSSVGELVLMLVDLALYVPPPGQPPEAEKFEWEV